MWVERAGKLWRVRDEIHGKRVTLKSGYTTKTAAKAAMAGLRADQLRGDFIDPRRSAITLNDFIDTWWIGYERSLKLSSRRTEGSRVRNQIRPLLGAYPLADLDQNVIQDFVWHLSEGEPDPADSRKWRRKPLSPKSIRNVHGVLHKILDAAVRARRLKVNPAADTMMPARAHLERRFLTPPEIDQLLAACTGEYERWKPLLLLLVSTGLRFGEALALRVGVVDVLGGKLTVVETMHHVGGGEVAFTAPKSELSRRTVVFPPEVAEALVPLVANKGREALVFTAEDGVSPVSRNFGDWTWRALRVEAGFPGLRLHDLRHTHAAVLISAGTPLTAVQRRLGHSSIRVTSDMYGHLMPEVHDSILRAVSASLPRQSGAPAGEGAVCPTCGNFPTPVPK